MNIALQLYTVRSETSRDFAGTLRQVAAMGYPAVEFAGYGGLEAGQLHDLLADTGLQVAGCHVALDRLLDDLDREIEYCATIGSPYLVLPWLPMAERSLDAFRALATEINEFGRRCRDAGLGFAYHNHDFEFARHSGRYLLDLFLDWTDPGLVHLELDVYWAEYAGADPLSYLEHHPGRVPLVHFKDMTAARTFTEVGAGEMPMDVLYEAAQRSGTKWAIVENDEPTIPPLESARRSLTYLRELSPGV